MTQAGSGEHSLDASQIFSEAETTVFSKVVTLAEKAGKHVELMVVPGNDPYEAVVQTAGLLQSSRIVMGLSPKLTPSVPTTAAMAKSHFAKSSRRAKLLSGEISPRSCS